MIKSLNHVMMWSKDLQATRDWYKDKLGFEISYFADGEFLSMRHDTMGRLDFHGTDGDENIGKGPTPYFLVEDIEKVNTWLAGKDIKVGEVQQVGDSPKHGWFWDNQGNAFGLEER